MGLLGFVLPPWISVPLSIAGRVLRAIPWQAWLALALALAIAALLLFSHWQYGRQQYAKAEAIGKDETAAVQARFDAYVAADIAAADAAKQAAKAAEEAQAQAFAAIEAKHKQELKDAKRKADAVAADLRAGNLRLRKQWQGCSAAAGRDMSETAGTAGVADADADIRATDAGHLVRIAAEADATILGLQAIVRTCTNPTAPP